MTKPVATGGMASVINNKTDKSAIIMREYGWLTKNVKTKSNKMKENKIPLYNLAPPFNTKLIPLSLYDSPFLSNLYFAVFPKKPFLRLCSPVRDKNGIICKISLLMKEKQNNNQKSGDM